MTSLQLAFVVGYLVGLLVALWSSLSIYQELQRTKATPLTIDFIITIGVVFWPIALMWGYLKRWFSVHELAVIVLSLLVFATVMIRYYS
jgi:hypothetical protein